MVNLVNIAFKQLATKPWAEFSKEDKQRVFGLLAVISGWSPPLRSGQPVQVEINN